MMEESGLFWLTYTLMCFGGSNSRSLEEALRDTMQQAQQQRVYPHLPRLLAPVTDIPYSGKVERPAFIHSFPSDAVHGYDIGGTLASATNRDKVIRDLLGLVPDADVKQCWFRDEEMTRRISLAQEEGILSGKINVEALPGVFPQLARQRLCGCGILAITVGTYQMGRSFLYGAGLEQAVDGLVTTEEAIALGVTPASKAHKKTPELFVAVSTALADGQGLHLASYTDNSLDDAVAAVKARELLLQRYGTKAFFPIYFVRGDTDHSELGETASGFIVISSLQDKR